jgi:hypothetical protein
MRQQNPTISLFLDNFSHFERRNVSEFKSIAIAQFLKKSLFLFEKLVFLRAKIEKKEALPI